MISLQNLSLIDLTHLISPQIPHWGNDCGFRQQIKCDYADCTSAVKFRVQQYEMVAGIGTHLDAPAHCIPHANTIDQIPLEQLIAPGFVIDVSHKADENYKIGLQDISEFEKQHGKITAHSIVIFYTGWSRYWNDPEKYRNNLIFPSVSKEVAEILLQRNINGIGIDTLSPDRADSDYPVHQTLLSANKFIIENVANADQLPPTGSYILALPIKVKDGTEAAVRLVGLAHSSALS